MKVLNLYAGIGGNRKLWEDVEVTAVEYDPQIAEIYSHFYPGDNVIVGDAHQYLLEHYREFDFIWASPPCPSHSDMRRVTVHSGRYPAVYPDLSLWQEITLLQHFAPKPAKWVVENVVPYYSPIVEPSFKLDRHCFWANFYAPHREFKYRGIALEKINTAKHTIFGFNISGFKVKDGRRLLRNLVNPEVGKYIFDCAAGTIVNEEQMEMFG